jgi:hypothetical protein
MVIIPNVSRALEVHRDGGSSETTTKTRIPEIHKFSVLWVDQNAALPAGQSPIIYGSPHSVN